MLRLSSAVGYEVGGWKWFQQLRSMSSGLVQSKAFIDGQWVDAANGETFEVVNPANGQIIGQVPNMGREDAEKAIKAANRAFRSNEWASLTGKQRSQLLKKWYRLIEEHSDEIADIITAESGKPITESKTEVLYGNSFLEWFAEEARRIYGEVVPAPVANREVLVIKQPIGVAGLITPWNFPLAMITRKAGAALAAGCSVVIKPAELTPLTALAVTKLSLDAGIPKGVINVVTTNRSPPIGELFCHSEDVHTISFTGSTEVGKLLYRQCSERVKRVSLELGGNAPFIVFETANLERALDGAMASKFRNCGQTCVASNRFFVQAGIYERFVSELKKRVESLKIGDGHCFETQVGPLINRMQYDKVQAFVEDARKHKANILCGGKSLPELGELFYAPTIVTDITEQCRLYQEEVFGPIIPVICFQDEEEAIRRANDTQRGLAGYFFSQDLEQVFRVARRLEVGMVGVNEGMISAAEAPFGGVKESGIGREGSHHGIDEYVNIKYICLGNLKYN